MYQSGFVYKFHKKYPLLNKIAHTVLDERQLINYTADIEKEVLLIAIKNNRLPTLEEVEEMYKNHTVPIK